MWEYSNYAELYHHGILGQKWGKRNGPPYPLKDEHKSKSERIYDRRNALDNSKDDGYNKNNKAKRVLSDKQKKIIAVGAAAVGTALVAYGGYRLYNSGGIERFLTKAQEHFVKHKPFLGDSDSFKQLSIFESISDTIAKTNPFRGTKEGLDNCVECSLAAFMRSSGFDCVAKASSGESMTLKSVINKCFKNTDVQDIFAFKFGKSPNDASEMLVKKFGSNASGLCGVGWKDVPYGHVFNWKTVNGKVSFFDGQGGFDDTYIRNNFWKRIDRLGGLELVSLDTNNINFEAINDFVS